MKRHQGQNEDTTKIFVYKRVLGTDTSNLDSDALSVCRNDIRALGTQVNRLTRQISGQLKCG
jgi:hypothetical protein